MRKNTLAATAIAGMGFMMLAAAAPAEAKAGAAAVPMDEAESLPIASSAVPTAAPLSGGDAQFTQMFADWRAIESGMPAGMKELTVSVPSRMPVEHAKVTSDYGMRTHPVLGGRRRHNGVDLAAPSGTPVYATADGYVEKAQYFGSYGNYVQLGHGGTLETRFAHLSRIAVDAGSQVKKGDLIGYVGSTGRSTGPHLHYEVRVEGQPVNPVPYMVETTTQQNFALARGEGGQGGD